MIRMLVGYPVYAERPTGDKQVRATPFAAQCEAGNVRLVKSIGANHAFIDELASFPFAKHDDQVDSASGAFNKLAIPPNTLRSGPSPLGRYRG
jgi:predicted phage terminase large subunit-like protein